MTMRTRISSQTKIINDYVQKVYFWMFIGLIITTITAYWVSQEPDLYNLILGNDIVFFGIIVLQFVAVISISALIRRIPDNLQKLRLYSIVFFRALPFQ